VLTAALFCIPRARVYEGGDSEGARKARRKGSHPDPTAQRGSDAGPWRRPSRASPPWPAGFGPEPRVKVRRERNMSPRGRFGVTLAGLLAASVIASGCTQAKAAGRASQSQIERGKYLVTVGGCNDCHTPLRMGPKGPEPDMSRMLSGHPESFAISEAVKPGSE